MDSFIHSAKNLKYIYIRAYIYIHTHTINYFTADIIKTNKANLQRFQGSIAALFTTRNHNDVTLFGYGWIQRLLQFPIGFSILFNSNLSRSGYDGGIGGG